MPPIEKPPVFTPEMRENYTILIPGMLPIHFRMLEKILIRNGYKVKILTTIGRQIVDEGLKNVHNDTCYPALLVIGQLISALKSGAYDPHKTALLITQTGGGCRASNYLSLLRKALRQSGYGYVPVISLNFSNLEKQPGFTFTPGMLVQAMYAIIYGDMLMWLKNQCKPYEIIKGSTDEVVERWTDALCEQFESKAFLQVQKNYRAILDDFSAIQRHREKKIKVGIVGEIYMKYAPLGNNNLEQFLIDEGAEPVLSGLLDFCMYCIQNNIIDNDLYGKAFKHRAVNAFLLRYFQRWQNKMIRAIAKHGEFRAPTSFSELKHLVDGVIGTGAKMGEGWLLTSEMVEHIHSGVDNIVCTQPLFCLPNHIVAKGMMRKIKDRYPQANIVAVDYDPSATSVNQENRLKLMLSNARLAEEFGLSSEGEKAPAVPEGETQRETVTL
ncbi:2-hydroxyacyl-CoA dehydratase [Acetanaerobacterium sp. MSJ-12]|uniref:2-hydroxyacyl-CoA dehydratase n=1 Tax=Acetanaerobacterium sp. MSJ-12 TaxID=2841535 RepID=UPI001C0E9784|nr:2-hydroxyacyl-CoA dehydratase [Acetanaerobacterium sp. MSJ-12]MBU5419926.1 2-hydroxyacyl-CoA dehydratase [Acetanaerobacterium sp. MSJ-12]